MEIKRGTESGSNRGACTLIKVSYDPVSLCGAPATSAGGGGEEISCFCSRAVIPNGPATERFRSPSVRPRYRSLSVQLIGVFIYPGFTSAGPCGLDSVKGLL